MTTSDVISELGNKWLPFPPEMFDERDLPPSVVAEMRSPLVTQAKTMFRYQVIQTLMAGERQRIAQREMARRTVAVSRVGKRVKTSRN